MLLRLTLVFGITLLIVAPIVFSAENAAEKPEKVTVVGVVTAVKDANGMPLSVTLAAKDVVYKVVLNKEGLKLADFDGREAIVEGLVITKDNQLWMTVLFSKEAERPKN